MEANVSNNSNGFKPQMCAIVFAIIWLIIVLSGCKSIEYVEVPKEVVKTEYRDRLQKDTAYVHDSIYVREDGDTKYVDRWHTKYVEKLRVDTCRVDHYIKECKYVEKQLTEWESFKMKVGGYCLFVLMLTLLGGIIYGIIKTKKLI